MRTDEIRKALQQVDLSRLQIMEYRTPRSLLREIGNTFRKNVHKEISLWYKSYAPKRYIRTGSMRTPFKPIRAADFTYQPDLQTVVLNLEIIKDTYKPSILSRKDADGVSDGYGADVLWLMNYGYQVKRNVWFKDVPYFGKREGGYFFEKAMETTIREYARYNIDIKLMFDGKEMNKSQYKKSKYIYHYN